ncbi:unnamed protein product [Brachionus calyciflorus]|uniref:Gustatory receptor n=1 Tax=Brachionus calyciflorus TaxID=104777 RepID=A0A814B3W0_9BILA|nr:unnamed protein product [Brachionus calyciflorus]
MIKKLFLNTKINATNDELSDEPKPDKTPKKSKLLDKNIEANYSNCRNYCSIMKFPLTMMRILGLYHRKNDPFYLKIYPLSVIVILWLSFARTFSLYGFWYGKSDEFSVNLVYKIIINLWCFITVFNATIIYINQEIYSRENQLIHDLSYFLDNHCDDKRRKRLRKKIILFFILGALVGILNSTAGAASLFGPDFIFKAFSSFLAPFHESQWAKESIPYKILNCIILSYTSFFWVLTIDYYLSHCDILTFIFENFNKDFRELINNNILVTNKRPNGDQSGYELEENFDSLRKKQLQICKIINQLDKCYKHSIGMSLIVYITIVLLLLYVMSDWNGNCINGIMSFLYPFWTINGGIILLLIVVFATRVHEKAIGILDDLLEVDIEEFTNSLCFKINMMINKLKYSEMSLTAFGIIEIDKQFILTVLGTLLSYFIVIYELKGGNSNTTACDQNSNSTNF